MAFNNDSLKSLPEAWRKQLSSQLDEGESLLGWFETDLDLRLHYSPGLVALTDRRLLASVPPGENTASSTTAATNSQANGKAAHWQSWLLSPDLKLSAADQAGVGTLELLNETERLAYWRYTAANGAAARRFEAQWVAQQARLANSSVEPSAGPTVCPSCGALITASDGVCTACAPAPPPPPVSSLFRLVIFRPPPRCNGRAGVAADICWHCGITGAAVSDDAADQQSVGPAL